MHEAPIYRNNGQVPSARLAPDNGLISARKMTGRPSFRYAEKFNAHTTPARLSTASWQCARVSRASCLLLMACAMGLHYAEALRWAISAMSVEMPARPPPAGLWGPYISLVDDDFDSCRFATSADDALSDAARRDRTISAPLQVSPASCRWRALTTLRLLMRLIYYFAELPLLLLGLSDFEFASS